MKQLFTFFLSALLLLGPTTWLPLRAQVLDPAFQPTVLKKAYIGGTQSGVTVLTVQRDGKILMAGGFDFVSGVLASKIQRLNADGTTDIAFNPGGIGANGFVTAVLEQPDGKILIGGGFTAYNSQPAFTVARLNANGTLDATFAQQPIAERRQISSLALQPDGKILVGSGNSFTAGAAGVLARLNANGTPDATFNIGAGAPGGLVNALLVQADGKIVVGGSFSTFAGQPGGLVRLNATGSVDTGFGATSGSANTNPTVLSLAQQADGKLLVGGAFTQINAQPAPGVARLLPTGVLDNTFVPGTGATTTTTGPTPAVIPATVRTIRVQSNGGILLGGAFTQFNGVARGRVARLLPTGALDPAFAAGAGANNLVFALAELATGQVLIGGSQTAFDNNPKTGLARLSATGADDATFAPVVESRGTLTRAVPLANGQLLVAGDFTNFNGTTVPGFFFNVCRLNANGSLDPTYIAPNAGTPLGVRPDGSFYTPTVTGANLFSLQRILPSGATDNAFTALDFAVPPNTGGAEVIVQPNGRLLVIGNFFSYGGVPRNGIARLNANGTLDTSFTPPTSTISRRVLSALVQAGGKIVITYQEPATGAAPGNTIARLNTDGTLDNTFAVGVGGGPNSFVTVLQQPDGKLLVSGPTSFNGQAAPFGLVRLGIDGTNDATFNGLTGFYAPRAVQPDGRILATEGANSTFALVRLNTDGSRDNTFTPVTIPIAFFIGEDLFNGLVLQPADNKIVVFGSFRTVAGQARIGLARLTNVGLATRAAAAALPLEVYPNPTSQRLTVLLPTANLPLQATLLDLTGRPVRRWTLPAHQPQTSLDLGAVAAGVYVLRIPGTTGTYQQKVVVTH